MRRMPASWCAVVLSAACSTAPPATPVPPTTAPTVEGVDVASADEPLIEDPGVPTPEACAELFDTPDAVELAVHRLGDHWICTAVSYDREARLFLGHALLVSWYEGRLAVFDRRRVHPIIAAPCVDVEEESEDAVGADSEAEVRSHVEPWDISAGEDALWWTVSLAYEEKDYSEVYMFSTLFVARGTTFYSLHEVGSMTMRQGDARCADETSCATTGALTRGYRELECVQDEYEEDPDADVEEWVTTTTTLEIAEDLSKYVERDSEVFDHQRDVASLTR